MTTTINITLNNSPATDPAYEERHLDRLERKLEEALEKFVREEHLSTNEVEAEWEINLDIMQSYDPDTHGH